MLSTLLSSGLKNWKTSLTGVLIAVLTVWQSGGFDGLTGQNLITAIGLTALGFFSRDANKSSQDSGVRK